MNEDTARGMINSWIRVSQELNDALVEIEQVGNPGELKKYKRRVGQVLGTMFFELAQPIFEEFPHLKPPQLTQEK